MFASLYIWVLLLSSHALFGLQQPYNVSDIGNGDHVNRHHSLSTSAPIANLLRSSTLRDNVSDIFLVFENVMAVIHKRRNSNDTMACNLRNVRWLRSAQNFIRVRQIGELTVTCSERMDLRDAVAKGELSADFGNGVAQRIRKAKNALFEVQRTWDGLPKGEKNNWTRGEFELAGWNLQRARQKCNVDSIFAYRVEREWYLRAGLTNNPVDAYMPDGNRLYVDEYVKKGFNESLRMVQERFYGEGLELSTTVRSRWGGMVPLATISNMGMDENPAVVEAMLSNQRAVDQAGGTITPSNIAILALPMVMTFLPVSFLADVNSCAMVWYVVFTDIFSVLPFLIKGVELLNTAMVTSDVISYFTGNDTLGQMEVWASECRGEDEFRTLGTVFVVVALGTLVMGVGLEIVAARVMKKRREEGGVEGPFGMAIFDATTYSALGRMDREEMASSFNELVWRMEYEDADWDEAETAERPNRKFWAKRDKGRGNVRESLPVHQWLGAEGRELG